MAANYMTGNTDSWEDDPPQVDSVWVQKLEMPLSGGRNMIMRIKYATYNTLPAVASGVYYLELGGDARVLRKAVSIQP